MRNRINGLYEYKIDSLSSIKITAQGSIGTNYSRNNYHQESMNDDGDTLSLIDRESTIDTDNKNFNSTLLWRQKFKKQGRTLSVALKQNYTENISTGVFGSTNTYFSNRLVDSIRVLDQQKITENKASVLNARVTYTEPLNKRSLLEFNYSIDNNSRQAHITTFEKPNVNAKEYNDKIDSLSNEYSFDVLTQSGGISYRYSKAKKITLSFGMNVSHAAYARKDLVTDSTFNYSFRNFYPQANVNWTMGRNGNLRFSYNGSTQAPYLHQIQPIRDITDQMNVKEGNPDLKQAFRHNLSLRYNNYKFLSERGIYAGVNFTTTQNDFSTMNTLYSTGKRVTRPVNVDGNYRSSGWAGYGQKIKKLGFRVGLEGNFNLNHNSNYIGELLNENDSYSFGGGPNLFYQKEKKFEIWMFSNFVRNISKTSLRSDVVTRYWTQDHNFDVRVFLPWKFEIGTSLNINIRQKTSVFENNNNVYRWNARLDRKLFKNDVVRLRFSANDILDQNIGFNRNINSNFISERTYDNIRRNFLLTLIWNFSKNGKPQSW